MANGIQTDKRSQRILDNYTGAGAEQDLNGALVGLFLLPTTLTDSLTLAGITEASFPGYARITLSSAHWPASSVAAHVASSTYGIPLVWICTGGSSAQTVYGLFVMDGSGTYLLDAILFDSGPYVMVNNGDTVTETYTVSQYSEY